MLLGTCKLCLTEGADLQESHLIPASAYKALRVAGSPPIVVKNTVTVQKDEQIKDFLLCAGCEQRFNDNGERWVLEHCSRSNSGFKLYDLLKQSTPLDVNDGVALYAGAGIPALDFNQLAYFASSVLWRGSVHYWHSGKDAITTPRLGPYEEQFRKYLLGEAPFPENAVLLIDVISDQNVWSTISLPYGDKIEDFSWQYRFTFLGIIFNFLLGKTIRPEFRRFCTYHSPEKYITMGSMKVETLVQIFGRTLKKSRVVGSGARAIFGRGSAKLRD